MDCVPKLCLIQLTLIVFKISYLTSASNLSICYKELGCFNITDDYKHLIYRPINLLPDTPQYINTKFILFTRANVKTGQSVNWDNKSKLKFKNFDGNKKTKFIIHGFIDNTVLGKWIIKLKDELLIYGDYNVFIVDWSDGNGFPMAKASANARVVGAQIALLIKNLKKSNGLKYGNCHIIGHSLGAHVAGYAGKYASNTEKIGRITGLDPSAPYFQYMPTTVRLDKSDAQFVDVIHTDTKSILNIGVGMKQSIGHIDFYPNGGDSQPGCTESRFTSFLTKGLIEGIRQLVECDHQRAVDYFIESINTQNKCKFLAIECNDWQSFNGGKQCTSCDKDGSSCAYLGLQSDLWKKFKNDLKSKKFYLKTNRISPYCAIQYKIEIPVTSITESKSSFSRISLKFYSNKNLINSNEIVTDLIPGKSFSTVLALPNNITSMNFVWNEEFDILEPNTWSLNFFSNSNQNKTQKVLTLNKIIITPLIKSSEKQISLCRKSDTGIKSNELIKFSKIC